MGPQVITILLTHPTQFMDTLWLSAVSGVVLNCHCHQSLRLKAEIKNVKVAFSLRYSGEYTGVQLYQD